MSNKILDFENLSLKVIEWGLNKGIIQNSSPSAQAIKTLEEVTELFDAINRKDLPDAKDAIGDIMVTLIMICSILKTDVVCCLNCAYEEIKDRKGHLTKDGIFIKE